MSFPLHLVKPPGMVIWFLLQRLALPTPTRVNAFDLLMKKKLFYPEKIKETTKKDSLYNDVVQLMIDKDFKFTSKDTAKDLARAVTTCLWNIDSNHHEINKAFAEHKCKPELPQVFAEFYKKQYNLWQEKKKAKPRLSQEQLYSSSDALFDVLSSMNIVNKCNEFAKQCKELASSLYSYADYLKKAALRMENSGKKDCDQSNNFILLNIIPSNSSFPSQYKLLNEQLKNYTFFEPMFIQNNLLQVPEDRQVLVHLKNGIISFYSSNMKKSFLLIFYSN